MENLKQILSDAIFEKTGLRVSLDHIHSDQAGWYYYVHKKSLMEGFPLILNHYRGPLMTIIPYMDYEKLKSSSEKEVSQYVEEASLSFGAFYGGGAVLSGVYYKPLQNKEEILKYMAILSCRVNRRSSGYRPTEEQCAKCQIKKCWFSALESKQENSIICEEGDKRQEFISLMRQRIEKTFGIDTHMGVSFCEEETEGDTAKLYYKSCTWDKPYIRMDVNGILLNQMLCLPEEFGPEKIQALVDECRLVLVKFPKLHRSEDFAKENKILQAGDDAPAVAKNFWEIGKEKTVSAEKFTSPATRVSSPKSWRKRLLKKH